MSLLPEMRDSYTKINLVINRVGGGGGGGGGKGGGGKGKGAGRRPLKSKTRRLKRNKPPRSRCFEWKDGERDQWEEMGWKGGREGRAEREGGREGGSGFPRANVVISVRPTE